MHRVVDLLVEEDATGLPAPRPRRRRAKAWDHPIWYESIVYATVIERIEVVVLREVLLLVNLLL